MTCLENRLKNAEDTFNIYLKVLKIRQTILERDSEVKTFIPTD